jgi:hypothetical protein
VRVGVTVPPPLPAHREGVWSRCVSRVERFGGPYQLIEIDVGEAEGACRCDCASPLARP